MVRQKKIVLESVLKQFLAVNQDIRLEIVILIFLRIQILLITKINNF